MLYSDFGKKEILLVAFSNVSQNDPAIDFIGARLVLIRDIYNTGKPPSSRKQLTSLILLLL